MSEWFEMNFDVSGLFNDTVVMYYFFYRYCNMCMRVSLDDCQVGLNHDGMEGKQTQMYSNDAFMVVEPEEGVRQDGKLPYRS